MDQAFQVRRMPLNGRTPWAKTGLCGRARSIKTKPSQSGLVRLIRPRTLARPTQRLEMFLDPMPSLSGTATDTRPTQKKRVCLAPTHKRRYKTLRPQKRSPTRSRKTRPRLIYQTTKTRAVFLSTSIKSFLITHLRWITSKTRPLLERWLRP